MKSKREISAVLEAIGEVSEKLAIYDAKYERLSIIARELAKLTDEGYTEDTSLVILRAKQLITEDEFDRIMKISY